jgi:hypothetical protein
METKQEISDKKERKKTADCAGEHVFFNVFLRQNSFLFFYLQIIPFILALFPFDPWSKKIQIGLQLVFNL